MSVLLKTDSLAKSFGVRTLFRGISLSLDDLQHVGLIGPNGAGKSTLLKILAGLEHYDTGQIETRRQCRIAYLPQEDAFEPGHTVESAILAAFPDDDHRDPHERHVDAQIQLTRLGFANLAVPVDALSGGWKKRLALARELIKKPDLLLLDEPTNHLDIEGILWLEEFLRSARFACLLISHDRYFLEHVADRIIELNSAYPDGYLSHEGAYSDFLEKREEFLAAQAARQQSLASVVRREIEWLKRGAKARTTKAKGRIMAAGKMMSDLADLRTRNAQDKAVEVEFDATGRQTRKLIKVKGVSKGLLIADRRLPIEDSSAGTRNSQLATSSSGLSTQDSGLAFQSAIGNRQSAIPLFSDLSFTLGPADKLGLLGPNGSGKSTLLALLRGEIAPDIGVIERADALRIVSFKQNRTGLDLSIPLRKALAPHDDKVLFQNTTLHVTGYARRFLFRDEQLDMPVGDLSGGEQSRVLLAQMMLQPADVLLLDEPTNDLDIPSLEVLEESLETFPGAIVLVTHDRFLLDRLCTDLLSLDGEGHANLYADLTQWEAARKRQLADRADARKAEKEGTRPAAAPRENRPPPGIKRLTYMEQREWEQIEMRIMDAEASLDQAQKTMDDPAVLADHKRLTEACRAVEQCQKQVQALYARWEYLEQKQKD